MKIRLPAAIAIDTEVDQGTSNGGYFLHGRLEMHLPAIGCDMAEALVATAHQECPYSQTRARVPDQYQSIGNTFV